MIALGTLLGCTGTPPSKPRPRVEPDAGARSATITSAVRCRECHGKISAEWAESGHARSRRAPLYAAMRARAEGPTCDRCHAPLAAIAEAGDPAVDEGVTCDVCHAIREVEVRRSGAGFSLLLGDNVKYGSLCGVPDHYFHRMGCSPLHEESRVCAACHLWYRPLPSGGSLPVYTEYEEWRESGYGQAGVGCQPCHMPPEAAEVAVGSGARPEVPHHGFRGREAELRRTALSLSLTASDEAGRLRVVVELRNDRGGHHVPTGSPEHQVVLRVRSVTEQGREVDRAERVYARTLVDERGAPAPFFAAVRQAQDSRIAPNQTRTESFDLEAPPAGRVEALVEWRPYAASVASSFGIAAPASETMIEARVPFGPPRNGGGRALLPRTVLVGR